MLKDKGIASILNGGTLEKFLNLCMRLGYYGLAAASGWLLAIILFRINIGSWLWVGTIAFLLISLGLAHLRHHPMIKNGELAAKVRTSLDGPDTSGGH